MNSYEVLHLLFLLALPVIWFTPGFLLRRWQEKKQKEAKDQAQERAIARLYPKEDQ